MNVEQVYAVYFGGDGAGHRHGLGDLQLPAGYARRLGLGVHAVLYPQPLTDDALSVAAALEDVPGVRRTLIPSPYAMPVALAASAPNPTARIS